MKIFVLTVGCILLLSVASLAQATSVYTSTRTCRDLSSNLDDGVSYEGECPGVAGYKVRLLEGDLRQSLTIVTPKKKKHELSFWQFFGGFSYIGEKLEWHLKKGVPVALISRLNVASPEDSSKSTSYLFVSKISATESCVTDIVKPSKTQNEEARKLADVAGTKPCSKVSD